MQPFMVSPPTRNQDLSKVQVAILGQGQGQKVMAKGIRQCRVCGLLNVKTHGGLPTCPECQKAKYTPVYFQLAKKRYRQTLKGQMTTRRYEDREDVKEKHRLYIAKYNLTAKGKVSRCAREAQRRARKMQADRGMTTKDWLEILERHKYRCFYCKKKDDHLTMDHVIPLNKGGLHLKENVVPACVSCNCKKCDNLVLLC